MFPGRQIKANQILAVASIHQGSSSKGAIDIVQDSLSRCSREDRTGRRSYNSKSVHQDNALQIGRRSLAISESHARAID